MIAIWLTVITMAVISLITGNPYALVAGLILAGIGVLVERLFP
jgi:thiamine transporter ThiT